MNLKKSLLIATVAMLAFFTAKPAMAQAEMMQPLPIDTAVHIGTLPNGLTYIVRHNAEPKNRANYYIAQRVGSILEDDNQRGLAHFLEHMAFNGTKNFPGKNLISFLERIGTKFGADLNAYTAFDETVYTIMDAPSSDLKVVDSCLLIMHDWSNNITLDPKEIDNERGVIHEEWRSRNSADLRLITNVLPKVLPNNKYPERLPIGSMDVIDNFPYEALGDFYKKWYRPDLQAIIVVGDIDPAYVINKLTEYFKDVPAPVNAAERYYVEIEDNIEPLCGIATDPEATNTSVSIMYKNEAPSREEKASIVGFLYNYFETCVGHMANGRFSEILQKPNAPFISAGQYISPIMGMGQNSNALSFQAIAREGEVVKALNALVAEAQRIRQHGFTESEYERARTNILKSMEDAYKERDKQKSGALVEEYKEYYLNGGYIPGIAMEYQLLQQIAPNIPVDMINQFVGEFIKDENVVLMVMGPAKDGLIYPTEAEFIEAFKAASKQEVEPYKEEVSDAELIDNTPKAGKIVSEKKNGKYGSTELTLSNGVKVYIKATDFKDDEILMSAKKPGGTLLYDYNKEKENLNLVNQAISIGGLGKFNAIDLRKALTGRSASVNASIGATQEGISGYSTKADFETMLQLTYLHFTGIRQDNDAYEAFVDRYAESLKSQEANPMISLIDSMSSFVYNDNPVVTRMKAADLDKVSYDRMLEIARERFADASGYQFYIVGNINVDEAKPLIAQWLGSLPANKKAKAVKPATEKVPVPAPGKEKLVFKRDLDTPMATILDVISAKVPYTHKNVLMTNILSDILDQMYTTSIREEEGGTYGVSSSASLSEFPYGRLSLEIFFNSSPERADQLNELALKELADIAKNGPNPEYVEKTKLNHKKNREDNLRKNGFWRNQLENFYYNNNKRDWVTDWEKTLDGITNKDIQQFVADILKQNNERVIIMLPTEK